MIYSFVIFALSGAILSGICLALFSPFVTLRKISYMGEALSHIAFAGIALAILSGLNLQITTTIFVVFISLMIGILSRKFKLEEANTITIFLSVSMALGITLISIKRSYVFDLSSYLFGNVLFISKGDLISLSILMFLNAGFIWLFFKELFYLTYNQEIARVYRIKTDLANYLFLILLAVNIVINLKITGIILVTAQLILPATIAFRINKRLIPAIIISILTAVLSAAGGFYLSWIFNVPTGAAIVLFEFVLYLLSLLLFKS
ncbi:MAG: metal ABC transporter permease [Candidatus Cloacimonetes bacterium]|nr:metal ABC transporter permease [Candidatus Cloacimonadota bacterium]